MPNHRFVTRRSGQRRNHILSRLTLSILSNALPERRTRTIGQAEYEVPSDMESSNRINLNPTADSEQRDHHAHRASEWVRTGLGEGRNTVLYKNTTVSIINSVSLIANSNGSLKVFIDAAGDSSREAAFRSFVRSANLPIVDDVLFRHCAAYESLSFYQSTDEVINNVMNLIQRIEPTFIAIKNEIFLLISNYRERYDRNSNAVLNETHQSRNHQRRNNFEQHLLRVLRSNQFIAYEAGQINYSRVRSTQHQFFSANSPQSSQFSNQGINAKALSEITNFEINSVPEEFCCSLSCMIMDDPVFDPAYPQYKFERKWIERSLQNKSENPYTRTPLLKTQLRADDSLKNRISDYMQRVTGQNTFCGLKPGFLK